MEEIRRTPVKSGAALDMSSPFDILADYYDVDMGLNNPGKDICFCRDYGLKSDGPVLELGCGTGRITLPLVQSGCTVCGLDNSERMLDQLARKAESQLNAEQRLRLEWHLQDMKDYSLERRFNLILCPFGAFNYLVEDEEQAGFFASTRKHLSRGGLFILDAFVPHHDISARADDHIYFDYRREIGPGVFLERHKTISKDLTRQISRRTRSYRVVRADGSEMRSFVMQDRVRYCHFRELQFQLQLHGFEVVASFGDYEYQHYRYEAEMMVFVTRLASGKAVL